MPGFSLSRYERACTIRRIVLPNYRHYYDDIARARAVTNMHADIY